MNLPHESDLWPVWVGGRGVGRVLLPFEVDVQNVALVDVAPDLKTQRRPTHTDELGVSWRHVIRPLLKTPRAVQVRLDLVRVWNGTAHLFSLELEAKALVLSSLALLAGCGIFLVLLVTTSRKLASESFLTYADPACTGKRLRNVLQTMNRELCRNLACCVIGVRSLDVAPH